MKKYNYIILFLLLTVQLAAQKLSGTVTYKVASVDYNYKGSDRWVKMLEMARKQQYELRFNDVSGSFKLLEVLQDENFDESANSSAQWFVSNYNYYYDFQNKLLLGDVGNGCLLAEKFTEIPWVITSEVKNIDKYQCYKATYTYEFENFKGKVTKVITAWFAPELPYAYGPKKYYGLPGLILQLKDGDVTFLATSIELFDERIIIKIPSGKHISADEYYKMLLRGSF